jgi:hypothetical protein
LRAVSLVALKSPCEKSSRRGSRAADEAMEKSHAMIRLASTRTNHKFKTFHVVTP